MGKKNLQHCCADPALQGKQVVTKNNLLTAQALYSNACESKATWSDVKGDLKNNLKNNLKILKVTFRDQFLLLEKKYFHNLNKN